MKAVGYIRCSTHEQADSGLGLAVQAERIRAYAVLKGFVLDIIMDAGVSGGKPLATVTYAPGIRVQSDDGSRTSTEGWSRGVSEACPLHPEQRFRLHLSAFIILVDHNPDMHFIFLVIPSVNDV